MFFRLSTYIILLYLPVGLFAQQKNLLEVPFSVQYKVEYEIPGIELRSYSIPFEPQEITGTVYSYPAGEWQFSWHPKGFMRLDSEKWDVSEDGIVLDKNRYTYLADMFTSECLQYNYHAVDGELMIKSGQARLHQNGIRTVVNSGNDLLYPFFSSALKDDIGFMIPLDVEEIRDEIVINPGTVASLKYGKIGEVLSIDRISKINDMQFSTHYEIQEVDLTVNPVMPLKIIHEVKFNDQVSFSAIITTVDFSFEEEVVLKSLFHEEPDSITIHYPQNEKLRGRAGRTIDEYRELLSHRENLDHEDWKNYQDEFRTF